MTPRAGVVDGLLAGRYRMVERLAAGGMGEVWRARDLLLHRDVAVKGLRPELVDDADVRARFRVEASSAGRLNHPRIALVYDFVEDDAGAWLVMELVDGEPLSALLRRDGTLSAARTLAVVEQTAAALQAAHDAGVVHRDVKPGNLLITADGTLSVTDFGIASAAGAASLTRTGQLVGTAGYLSPEQASGAPATPASDLYALGVVAFECLAGRRPFDAENPVAVLLAHLQSPPPALPPDVDPEVADLVLSLLAKDPAERPQSAAELATRAQALREDGSAPGAVPAAATAAVTQALPVVAVPAGQGASRRRSGAASVPLDRDTAGAAATGLAGRPGQRRAVRVTALALVLLAVGFGARGSFDRSAPPEVAPAQPEQSAPVASTAPSRAATPAATPEPAPVVPPADTPGESAVPPATGPAQGGPAQDGTADGPDTADTAPGRSGDAPGQQVNDNGNANGKGGGGNGQGNGGNGGGGNGGGGRS